MTMTPPHVIVGGKGYHSGGDEAPDSQIDSANRRRFVQHVVPHRTSPSVVKKKELRLTRRSSRAVPTPAALMTMWCRGPARARVSTLPSSRLPAPRGCAGRVDGARLLRRNWSRQRRASALPCQYLTITPDPVRDCR